MKPFLLILAIFSFMWMFAYDWSEIIPGEYEVEDVIFTPETMAATPEGILYHEFEGWQLYTTDLPVWQLQQISENEVIFIMGDGSWSDGIYKFNLETGEQTTLEYAPWPKFIYCCDNDEKYYIGFSQGLLYSVDGESWFADEFFDWKTCQAMIACGENYIVSGDFVYYSENGGTDWQQTEISWSFCSMAVIDEPQPTFYAVFPGASYSSGLYSSENAGADWQVVFYHVYLTDILRIFNDMTFVSFADEDEIEPGVASYNFAEDSFTYYNNGLPDVTVNTLTVNPLVNCLNVVPGTDAGAYMLTGFATMAEQPQVPMCQQIKVYPNPFNPQVTISFDLVEAAKVEVGIYNLKGQLVNSLNNRYLKKGSYKFIWNGKHQKLQDCASGIYFCKIEGEDWYISRKLLLLR